MFAAVCELSLIDLLYDMRRTSDVEGFMKAWSNSNLFKKLVYGSSGNNEARDRLTVPQDERAEDTHSQHSHTTVGQGITELCRSSLAELSTVVVTVLGSPSGSAIKPWQSCISFALKVSQLSVQSYIGHIMGQTRYVHHQCVWLDI